MAVFRIREENVRASGSRRHFRSPSRGDDVASECEQTLRLTATAPLSVHDA